MICTILIFIQILSNHSTAQTLDVKFFIADTNYLLRRKVFIHLGITVVKVLIFMEFDVSAQVLFEKMREIIQFLPDPRPSLKVSEILWMINSNLPRNDYN